MDCSGNEEKQRRRIIWLFFFSKTNGDVAGVLRLTFDEFLCFKEEEDGKIMHTERHETFASLNSMST